MKCIKDAEAKLKHYRDLSRAVKNAQKEIHRITYRTVPRKIKAAAMDETGVRANVPINTMNEIYQLNRWQTILNDTEEELRLIDDILTEISQEPNCDHYKDVLIMWYVERRKKDEICEKINYSTARTLYRIRNKAIRKFAVSMFGIEALNELIEG